MAQGVVFSFLASERYDSYGPIYYVVGTLVLTVIIQCVLNLVRSIRRRFRDLEALKEFTGPEGHWFYGNLKDMLKYEERTKYTRLLVRKFPKAAITRMDPFHYQLRVHHPETIKAITSTPEPKDPFGYRFLMPWIGEGLLVSKGHRWARNRRLLTPAFHFDILKPYVNIFSKSAFTMANKWKSILRKKNEPMEMFEHVSMMTLDSLMKCIFGFQGDCQIEGFKHPYIQGVSELAHLTTKRFFFFPYHNDIVFNLSWMGYKYRRACRLVHEYSWSVIADKRREHAENPYGQDGRNIDFMDMLLQAKDEDGVGLTDAEIQAEVDTFMFEGHDTTASGISWCLYNLARHPEYQAKCRQEVNSILGDREQFVWDDVHNLPFLTMCVKESLRLHPPVPATGRQTTKPLRFPDGRTIPEGILILVSIYGCHMNPEVWENPEVYDPYRFTPENSKGRSPHAFLPFSAGPRNCIGQHFALHEIKVSIGQVLRHFELSVPENHKPIMDPVLVLRAKDGIKINVKPIEQ